MEAMTIQKRAAGYVCPATGRVAVCVADLADSALNGDITAYWLDEEAELCGLDGWRTVEGIDPHVDATAFDVWFGDGGSITVKADALVYLRWSDAHRLAGGKNNWKATK